MQAGGIEDVVRSGPMTSMIPFRAGKYLIARHRLMDDFHVKALVNGFYEAAEIELVTDMMTSQDRVLEIGTGLGVVALHIVSRVGSANFRTYEANPELAEAAGFNIGLNGESIDIRNRAIVHREASGAANLAFFVKQNFLASSLTREGGAEREIRVAAVRLEDELAEFRPSAVVMDVEGEELHLLRCGDLGTVAKLIVELHPAILGSDNCAEILRHLRALGFVLDLNNIRNAVFGLRNSQTYLTQMAKNPDQQAVEAIVLDYLGALVAATNENYPLAIEALERVIAHCPTNPDFRCSLGSYYLRAGDPRAASRALMAAVDQGLRTGRLYYILGNALMRADNIAGAEAAAGQAIALAPGVPENHKLAAFIALRTGRHEEATRQADIAFEFAPQIAEYAELPKQVSNAISAKARHSPPR